MKSDENVEVWRCGGEHEGEEHYGVDMEELLELVRKKNGKGDPPQKKILVGKMKG